MAEKKPSKFFKLPFFRSENKKVPERVMPQLRMLFFITDWEKSEVISKVFEEERVRFHFITKGRGTARSDVLDLLGIGASDKAVILCVEQEILVPILLKDVRKKLGFYTPGAGIAFTIPLSGINTPLLKVFKESIYKNEKIMMNKNKAKVEGETMASNEKAAKNSEIKNDLVVAIINNGFSDDFMTTAREAGASGGTVIHARGLAHEGPVKFFGVSVQEEKEIVLVLASREKKVPIMQAVSSSFGITSKAEGFVFSLPVDSVMGLNLE